MAAYRGDTFNFTGEVTPERLRGQMASADNFATLGVKPIAKESLDGPYICYARQDTPLPTLRRVPTAGGEEVQVVREMSSWASFAVARAGILFRVGTPGTPAPLGPLAAPFTRRETAIDLLCFSTGRINRGADDPSSRWPWLRRVTRWAHAPVRSVGFLHRGSDIGRRSSASSTVRRVDSAR